MSYQDSIEYKAEKIYHHKTKEYFDEVMSSYQNGNYRSAVVMLYSVVICDIIYKLQELSDRYADKTAISILEKIKDESPAEENASKEKISRSYSQWENTLLKEVMSRTNLLEPQDKCNIDYLKKNRNFSAHPVLDELDMLVRPNKETVRANIANMLDGVLCKSPLLSNKIIDTFLNDLVSIDGQIVKQPDLERYLINKYFQNLNKTSQEKLFKDLWKFAFKLENERTSKHRRIIYKSLLILFNQDRNHFTSIIHKNTNAYSNINLDNGEIIEFALDFWSRFPMIYKDMNEALRVEVETKVFDENNFSLFSQSVFLSESISEHLDRIKLKMEQEKFTIKLYSTEIELLFNISEENGLTEKFLDFLITSFSNSVCFDDANHNFQNYIAPYGKKFTESQFERIIEGINNNNQLYKRAYAKRDNALLIQMIDNNPLEMKIDYSKYPDFVY